MIKSALQSSLTNDVKYRNMGAVNLPSNEYLIASTILTQPEPTVVFDNLNQFAGVYRHLQIVMVTRGTQAVTEVADTMRINGDATNANYSQHFVFGDGATVASFAASPITLYGVGASAAAGHYTPKVVDILDAYSTKNKTLRFFWGAAQSGYNRSVLQSALWMNTAAISSISMVSAATWAAGSRFSIYGVTA